MPANVFADDADRSVDSAVALCGSGAHLSAFTDWQLLDLGPVIALDRMSDDPFEGDSDWISRLHTTVRISLSSCSVFDVTRSCMSPSLRDHPGVGSAIAALEIGGVLVHACLPCCVGRDAETKCCVLQARSVFALRTCIPLDSAGRVVRLGRHDLRTGDRDPRQSGANALTTIVYRRTTAE